MAFNQLLLLLRDYTIKLYKELADDPAYPINYHHGTGGLRLLTHPDHIAECHHIISVARGLGLNFELLDRAETGRRNPLLDTQGVLASLWDDRDGDIDPAQLCQALASRARKAGAKIYRHTAVTGLTQKPNHEWLVETSGGTITAEHIVIAAGYRVNEVGGLMGITYPVIAMEHMYFITEDIPELQNRTDRVPMVRCPRDTFYMRQEKKGLLVGIYEHDCKTFGMDGIDPDFANALCPNDLDRLLPKMEPIFERIPCLKDVGIKSVVNGPISYAADADPLVGKQPGLRNCWSMNGLRVGIGEGGGYGKMLAQMIVHGESEWDAWQLDPRRITSHATVEYTALKAVEDYRHEFQWHKPHEHRPAGRPAKSSPLYETLKKQGAAFGVVNGWERASFFKPHEEFLETHVYEFPNWHGIVKKEVESLSASVGIAELAGFNQYRISGDGALEWLEDLTCSKVSKSVGRASLCYFLTGKGNIACEATLLPLPNNEIFYGSAAAAEFHDMDWLKEQLPVGSSISVDSYTNSHTMLLIAGPKSRKLLAAVSPDTDWSQQAMPWLTGKFCRIGNADVLAIAISYSGEQAFELHVHNDLLCDLYGLLTNAGAEIGMVPFGMYAIESMRLEKGYGHWKSDLITEFNPVEAGLERFVDFNKSFVGKSGLIARMENGNRRVRVMLELNVDTAPAQPGEGVFANGRPAGSITSAAWGYRTGKNLAMAYLEPEFSSHGTQLEVHLLGNQTKARVCALCQFDPENRLPRGLP